MLPEKAQDDEIAEAEYLVLPQSAESNARILKEVWETMIRHWQRMQIILR